MPAVENRAAELNSEVEQDEIEVPGEEGVPI